MLKKSITYQDFNGDQVTETFYFNLTKTELIDMELKYNDGMTKTLERIISTQDPKVMIPEFQKLILASYGVKSEDGKRFIKSEVLREEFSQMAAYDALFMELATDDKAAAAFVNGIVPKDLVSRDQDKPVVTPPPLPPS